MKTGIQYLPADSIQISWQSLSRSHCLNSRIELLKADLLFRHFQQFFSIRTVKAGSVRYAESPVLLHLIPRYENDHASSGNREQQRQRG